MFDWQRTVETYKPDYYKWTQWLFTELFKSGLAYRKNSEVSWCPSCKTVLSDEQVENGECERCGSKVVQKELNQWFFKITDYTERLLENLDWIKWDKDVKIGQKNWIGKKIGINIDYKVNGADETITCFTTRPDTNFGATFIVLAPEHPFVDKILNKKIQVNKEVYSNIKEYVENAKAKTELDRISEGRNKTGVFTSFKAVNILNGKEISIWISDFVLGHFGTGAVVGVPGHDKRDFEFASKFDIEIIRVVVGPDGDESEITTIEQVQESEGYMINSEFLNKMHIMDAKERIMDYLEEKGFGNRVINYNLRDWCVSRQRYWGPPIPMIFSQEDAQKGAGYFDGEMPGWWPEDELPVLLPEIERFEDILPDGSGKGPLEKQSDFVNTISKSGRKFQRETDVSDPFVDSSWYFLRYPFVGNDNEPFEFVKRSNLGEKVDLDSTFIEEFKKVYSSISKKSIRPIVAGDIALFALNGEAFKNIKEIEFGFVTKQELDFAAKIIEELGYKPSGEYFKNGDFTIRMSSKGYEDMYLGYRLDFQGEKIRIADPRFLKSNFKEGIESEIIEFWLSQTINKLFPVHHYIGGKEHTVLHLLYARFITMVLNDLGYIDFEEPFENFYGHGLITKDGSKMSKS
ncbi:MAG TPA: class I tRNA ligase family protein, partial [Candidatus Dojkabacteria bacterium]